MTATIVTVSLTLALSSFGLGHEPDHDITTRIISKKTTSCPPGPGSAGAFPTIIPIITDGSTTASTCRWGLTARPSITFPRYFAVPPDQMFIQTYYNPFETRGQRYIPYVGAGGDHPAGGPPTASACHARDSLRGRTEHARGSGSSFDRQGRGRAASVRRFGVDALIA